jgi:hypothetical protein
MLVLVAEVVLAELAGAVAEGLEQAGDGGISGRKPSGAPGMPTLLRPVRNTFWPEMKAARPAVQLCSA